MDAYTGFAQVYDLFMDNVPYGEWSRFLVSLLAEAGIADGAVAELGCGTGKMTRLLAGAGYDMIGVDNSEEMLEMARSSDEDAGKILYLLQNMGKLELYGTVRAVVSVCDCLNYILSEDGLLEVFRRVRECLDADGIFYFDMNTVYKYRELLGECTISENRDEGSFIWENYFYEDEQINEYDLTLFIREKGGLYRKYEETHCQRAYPAKTVERLLREAGFSNVAVCDAYTKEPLREDGERMGILAYGK